MIAHLYKILYILVMSVLKPVEFLGSALDDLRTFPIGARREAGHQLDRVQRGLEPDDWKPMNTIGQGVREIRIREAAGTFRVIYVAKFAEAVYVLHCFQKKTQRTGKADLELAAKRYRNLVKEIAQ
ncbi:type II toxin-antitoxin system RelE/ParE family toxin [Thermithiobacillus tepidarius DSM 3134]|uniref:type II toxin-antitoxin system RelE/ParE family toxin n=1 Tax=Thermithiobacillus tepidarius TaxID=929 RepID=UPI003AABF0B0